ncbi:DedA family protein [Gemmata sp. G18]|uniref:DedA family protein n=1 Tax=Gemmata palustris TaxID=2822762 RepID=A0ABS5BNC2_9BACT|nr:DedA family protein [Gemmata palustris]MBP3955229.1 DedA family protein [Gemmata palustris]
MLEHFGDYGYLGVFVALIASATVVPLPEELPVITAGILVGHEGTSLRWYIMLPVLMAGVVIGDGALYGIGRFWGRRLLHIGWVQRKIITPEKREQIEKNFHDRGIMILLGARMLPGIRGPIFMMAGVLRVPLGRFLLADAIYAIPLVNIIFWLSYFLTDQVLLIFNKINEYKPLVIVAILSGIAGAMIQKYVFGRHVSTGEPPHVPTIIAKPAVAMGHVVGQAVEMAVDTVTGRHHDKPHEGAPAAPDGAADQEFGIRVQEPSANGNAAGNQVSEKKADEKAGG